MPTLAMFATLVLLVSAMLGISSPGVLASPAVAETVRAGAARAAAGKARLSEVPNGHMVAQVKSATAQFTYRLGTSNSPDHPIGVFADTFKQQVELHSQGRISVQVFPRSQLGAELTLLNSLVAGQLDLAIVAAPIVGNISRAVQLAELPFLFPDWRAARKVLEGEAGQMILRTFEVRGAKGLAFGALGFRGLLNNRRPVNTAADLRGMKVRVIENPLFVATWQGMGANPVPMAWTEVYMALQQKTIDAVDTSIAGMIDTKLYEVAKYLAQTNHIYTSSLILMNLAKFRALPPDLAQVVLNAAEAGAGESWKTAAVIEETGVETMKKHGVTVTVPPREEFVAATKAVYNRFVPEVGAEIYGKAQAVLGSR